MLNQKFLPVLPAISVWVHMWLVTVVTGANGAQHITMNLFFLCFLILMVLHDKNLLFLTDGCGCGSDQNFADFFF